MTKFILGLFIGIILATSLSVFAQLVPFDAPLAEQLNGQRAEAWLRSERAIERWESSIYRDPVLQTFGTPCRK